jgi:F0F1-type ATP synthase assembly protein I
MAKESDDPDEQSFDDLKEEVRSLQEKLAKQQKLTDQIAKDRRKKSMTAITLLAVILGAFGICGIGHFYAGKKLVGTLILIGGLFIVLVIAFGWNVLNDPYAIIPDPAMTFNLLVLWILLYLVLYGFQIFHARHYCQKYNELIEHEKLN